MSCQSCCNLLFFFSKKKLKKIEKKNKKNEKNKCYLVGVAIVNNSISIIATSDNQSVIFWMHGDTLHARRIAVPLMSLQKERKKIFNNVFNNTLHTQSKLKTKMLQTNIVTCDDS